MEGNWKNWYAWSRSKQAMFDLCPRQFFYRYVKFYDVKLGHILKSTKGMIEEMHNLDFLLGDIVHAAIKRQFDQLSRGREVTCPGLALQFITRTIDDIQKDPKSHIIESMNGKEISKEEISRIDEDAARQIKIFFNEFFDFYKDLEIIEHEDYCNIVIDGHKFYLVPDLITKSKDGRIYITDWKTDSTYAHAIDEWQMNMYILWALEEGLSDFDNIRSEVIFLDIGDSTEYSTTEEKIDSFKKLLIEKSDVLFNSIDSKSCKDDFNKCDNDQICIGCGFKPYCKKD